MAIGTIDVLSKGAALGPVRVDVVKFAGDSSYPTGGTAAFQASLRTALGAGAVEVLGVAPLNCGGYVPAYDYETGKLLVYYSNSDAADGPLIEVPNSTNLSGVNFQLTVTSK